MGHRPDLGALNDTDRKALATRIKAFLTQAVITNHRKVNHMEQFFAHHRAYIFGLETFLKRNITDAALRGRVVPLPFWDSRMPLPSHFKTFNGGPAVAPNTPPPATQIPPPPLPPLPPPPFSTPARVRAYLRALRNYGDALVAWKKDAKDRILLNPPVTDTNYLNTAYPGKAFPAASGLDHPENFGDPHELCEAHDNGRGLGMDITEGLIRTATHYHGITHSSLAGLDTPVDENDLINYVVNFPSVSGLGTIGPFMNGGNTAAPFIFWPLHAFFDTLYYTWEQEHLRPLVSAGTVPNSAQGGELELFQLGKGGLIWHCCHAGDGGPNTDNGRFGNWEHWHRIGGDQPLRRMALATAANGEIELFGITSDSNKSLVHTQMLGNECENWSSWEDLGGSNKEVVAISSGTTLSVFAIHIDDGIWFRRKAGNAAWTTWDQLFDVGQSRVAAIADGTTATSRVHVFSLANGYIWHRWETSAGGNWVGPNEHLVVDYTRRFTDFKVARNKDKRLEVFAIGTDKKVYHAWQTAAGANNGFSAWERLHDSDTHDIAVGANQDGRLELFLCGGGTVRHKWQVAPNSGWTANAEEIPLDVPMGSLKQPFTANDPDGRLMVFGTADDGLLWHAWQNAANQGPWLAWLVI